MIAPRGDSLRRPGPGLLLPWSSRRATYTRSNPPPTIFISDPASTQHKKKLSSPSSASPSPPTPSPHKTSTPTESTAPSDPPHPRVITTPNPPHPPLPPRHAVDRPAGFDLLPDLLSTGGRARRTDRHGEEAGDAAGAGARGGAVGAAVAVGQDGLLPRLHARLAAPRLRAAAPHRPPRPPPPARAPLQLPPRPPQPHPLPPRPRPRLPLPLLPRRPPRRLRRPLHPHPLRVHGVRGRRGLPVGGGGVQRRLPLLRPRQGRRRLRRGRRRRPRARPARQRPARRRGGHVPHVARARRRPPRHGIPGQQPREAPAPRRLQNRHRSSKAKRNPHTEVAEAMHRMTHSSSCRGGWKRILKGVSASVGLKNFGWFEQ